MKNKKNAPKFLVGRNEVAQPGKTFIVHTQEPQFVGELLRFDSQIDMNQFLEDNLEKELIKVTPTSVFLPISYFNTEIKINDKSYLENKLVNWIIANVINSSVG